MTEFDDNVIAAEAYRLWAAEGSPLWGHPQDHWYRAIDSLRARSNGAGDALAAAAADHLPEAPRPGPGFDARQ